ncbi:hypothetical protein EDC01DRAFT_680022 [Geopyxis carbonaria]|nr:hypothetical protein EDC01DRAFT_680022 [Geopyxis carbonaria]
MMYPQPRRHGGAVRLFSFVFLFLFLFTMTSAAPAPTPPQQGYGPRFDPCGDNCQTQLLQYCTQGHDTTQQEACWCSDNLYETKMQACLESCDPAVSNLKIQQEAMQRYRKVVCKGSTDGDAEFKEYYSTRFGGGFVPQVTKAAPPPAATVSTATRPVTFTTIVASKPTTFATIVVSTITSSRRTTFSSSTRRVTTTRSTRTKTTSRRSSTKTDRTSRASLEPTRTSSSTKSSITTSSSTTSSSTSFSSTETVVEITPSGLPASGFETVTGSDPPHPTISTMPTNTGAAAAGSTPALSTGAIIGVSISALAAFTMFLLFGALIYRELRRRRSPTSEEPKRISPSPSSFRGTPNGGIMFSPISRRDESPSPVLTGSPTLAQKLRRFLHWRPEPGHFDIEEMQNTARSRYTMTTPPHVNARPPTIRIVAPSMNNRRPSMSQPMFTPMTMSGAAPVAAIAITPDVSPITERSFEVAPLERRDVILPPIPEELHAITTPTGYPAPGFYDMPVQYLDEADQTDLESDGGDSTETVCSTDDEGSDWTNYEGEDRDTAAEEERRLEALFWEVGNNRYSASTTYTGGGSLRPSSEMNSPRIRQW